MGDLPPVRTVERRKNMQIVHFDHQFYEEKQQSNSRALLWINFDAVVGQNNMQDEEHLELEIKLRKRVACRYLSIKALSFLEDFD